MSVTDSAKRNQVADQCRAVAHMADALSDIYTCNEKMIRAEMMDELISEIGFRSAALMEELGDILNGMDAVTEEDDWVNPIFEKSKELYPPKEQ